MAKYYLLALGFFLAITGSFAVTIDELTDADLTILPNYLKEAVAEVGFTCANYESKCGAPDSQEGKVCQVIMKKYTCEKLTDSEGIKQILKAVEAIDPAYIAESLQQALPKSE